MEAIIFMGCGGYWGQVSRGFLDTQIERGIADGRLPDAQRRFVHAMQFGGCTTSEAMGIIRDRDCAHHGLNIELWDVDDLPGDRWFRNAWRRSHNGGPIGIDIKLARPIQWSRAKAMAGEENKRRADAFDAEPELVIDWERIRTAIRHARDEHELQGVWPDGLRRTRHG